METLEAANERNRKRYFEGQQPRPNGIACPKCGSELKDIVGLVLTTDPPQLQIVCESCGYKGARVA